MSMEKNPHIPEMKHRASRVQQHMKDDADITKMVARHLKGPQAQRSLPMGNPNATRKPMFGDFTQLPIGYHEMLNMVMKVDQVFAQQPARVRARFHQRPELLIDFIKDPANVREAVKLGLIEDPEILQAVMDAEAQADAEAAQAAEAKAPKADDEAQPRHRNSNPKDGD